MSVFGDVANAITASTGRPRRDMTLAMVQAAYPAGHPEVLFAQWLHRNFGCLREACVELGVSPPPPGDHLYQRLKDTVMPLLGAQ